MRVKVYACGQRRKLVCRSALMIMSIESNPSNLLPVMLGPLKTLAHMIEMLQTVMVGYFAHTCSRPGKSGSWGIAVKADPNSNDLAASGYHKIRGEVQNQLSPPIYGGIQWLPLMYWPSYFCQHSHKQVLTLLSCSPLWLMVISNSCGSFPGFFMYTPLLRLFGRYFQSSSSFCLGIIMAPLMAQTTSPSIQNSKFKTQ